MKDTHPFDPPEAVSEVLRDLESEFPSIREDYDRLFGLLVMGARPGERLDPADLDLEDVFWTHIHITEPGAERRGAAVLVYASWEDVNARYVQSIAIYRGSDWNDWSAAEQRELVKKLV